MKASNILFPGSTTYGFALTNDTVGKTWMKPEVTMYCANANMLKAGAAVAAAALASQLI